MDDVVWDHPFFSKIRDRLLNSDIASAFFGFIRDQAKQKGLISNEHFTVDDTLLEAWASMKSFRPKNDDDSGDKNGSERNPSIDYRGQQRTNDTHESITDPDAMLYKKAKGHQAKLCNIGYALMENRNGLVADTRMTVASGTPEHEATVDMIENIAGSHRITVGADKGNDCADFVSQYRGCIATAHVAQKEKGTGIDGRTTRHIGYPISLRIRKRVEEVFGAQDHRVSEQIASPGPRKYRCYFYDSRNGLQPDPDTQSYGNRVKQL
jgi:hypothetical protein